MIPERKNDRSPDDEEALLVLSEAYHATQAYYAQPESSRGDAGSRMDIADKWCRAGILLQKYDPTLANRLDLKSRYWREGATWSDAAIKDAKIGLDNVWRETNALLQSA